MGLLGVVLGCVGFGWGVGIGVLLGYFVFIYSRPSDVKDPEVKPVVEQEPADHKRMLNEIPIWAGHPDWERVGWLNSFVKELWPFLDQAVAKTVRAQVAPLIEQYKPKMVTSIDFVELTLGSLPIVIDGVKVVETQDDEMILQMNAKWAGNPNIKVAAKAMGATVTVQVIDLFVQVGARATFKPLVDVFPCFSGIFVSLIDKPKVDFGLRLVNGDLMAIPGLLHAVQDIIKETVAGMFLWPRKLQVFDSGMAVEKGAVGMLNIKVVGAKNLKATDVIGGKTDPFVQMWLHEGSKKLKTKTVTKNCNPVWNELFKFTVLDPEVDVLTMQVYDWNRTGSSKNGIVVIPVKDLPPDQDKALDLKVLRSLDPNDSGNAKERGTLQVVATYMAFKEDDEPNEVEDGEGAMEKAPEGSPDSGGVLRVTIHEALELELKGGGVPNAYAKVRFHGQEKKTVAIRKSANPNWEDDPFEFILDEPPLEDNLYIEVFSKPMGAGRVMGLAHSKPKLGHLEIPLVDVVNNRRINQMYSLTDSARGQIKVELQWLPTR